MILETDGVSFSYGADVILKSVSFSIGERERVGLTGYNGCGKTTLLNLLTGELSPAAGTISYKAGVTVGYLKQTAGLKAGNTVYGEMKSVNDADALLRRMKELERTMGDDPSLVDEYASVSARYEAVDGYNLDHSIKRILNGMGFSPETHEKRVDVLSGGEKTRLALSKLLIMSPDMLILDEPTNHLDMDTLEWLEEFLRSYRGAVLTVSHDRYFLDRVTTKTVELQNGVANTYSGSFSHYMRQKREREEREQREYRRTVEEAEKLRTYAEKNIVRASTSKMAKSRLKMLDRLDLTAPDSSAHTEVRFSIEPAGEPYKEVLEMKDLEVAAGGRTLISGLSLTVMRGEVWAVVGANGTGKTTLLSVIMGKKTPKSGRLRMGGGVKAGYLEQNVYTVRSKNPLEYIWDMYPSMSQLEVRSLLASVGFRGEEVFTSASGLSGGELERLGLARLSLEHPNLLVLDEPTNHLDIYTRDILCEALREYKGTMIVVTHDRYLIEQLGCKVLCLENGAGKIYRDFESYRAAHGASGEEAGEKIAVKAKPEAPTLDDVPGAAVKDQKELRRIRAAERERKAFLEKRIDELEQDIAYLEERLQLPEVVTDPEKLSDLCAVLESEREELAKISDEWLESYAD